MQDTTHFKRHEFLCPCCQQEKMQQPIIDFLQKVSDALGNTPLRINSGYRCPKHSVAIGGYKDDAHVAGYAADIHCPTSAQRWQIVSAAITLGCKRIGIGKTFVHLDVSPSHPQCQIWTYYN